MSHYFGNFWINGLNTNPTPFLWFHSKQQFRMSSHYSIHMELEKTKQKIYIHIITAKN